MKKHLRRFQHLRQIHQLSQRGSTIIEVIVATGIVALVMTAIVSAISVSILTTAQAKARSLGTRYSQEGMEYFRKERGVLGWEAFVDTIETDGGVVEYCLPTLPTTQLEFENLANRECSPDNANDYVKDQGRSKEYLRQATITVNTVGSLKEVVITVTSTWQEGDRERSTSIAQKYEEYSVADIPIPPSPTPGAPRKPSPTPATPLPSPTPSGSPVITNLALGRTPTQSSTLTGYVPAPVASKSNDNNTNGNYGASSVSHTNANVNAWWEVDLGSIKDITTISIWNRTDCCAARTANYYVLVSETAFASKNLAQTLSQSGVLNFYQSAQAGRPTTITVNHTGRYVRVQLNKTDYLNMAEVQVFGF